MSWGLPHFTLSAASPQPQGHAARGTLMSGKQHCSGVGKLQLHAGSCTSASWYPPSMVVRCPGKEDVNATGKRSALHPSPIRSLSVGGDVLDISVSAYGDLWVI